MRYLVCADGSDDAENAFVRFLTIIRPENDSVYLLTGFPLPSDLLSDPFEISEDSLLPVSNEFNDELKYRREKAHELLEDLKRRLVLQKVSTKDIHEIIIDTDDPGKAICDAATSNDVDMIVLGTRGLGTVARIFLGSVSDYVVHHAPCSVFVAR